MALVNNPQPGVQWQHPPSMLSSTMQVLPSELFLEIASNLPPASAAAFATTCNDLRNLLDTEYRQAISGDNALLRIEYLRLLEKDSPDHIACRACLKLHPIANHQVFCRVTRQPKCVLQDLQNNIHLYLDLGFRTSSFAMATKRISQNRYQEAEGVLQGLNSDGYIRSSSNFRQLRLCRSATQSVRGGHRILCQEQVCISTESATTHNFSNYLSSLKFCPHLGGHSSCCSIVVTPLRHNAVPVYGANYDERGFESASRYGQDGYGTYNRSSGVIKCQFCAMECRLDLRFYEGHGLALFFTMWKDLGTGPQDPQFEKNWKRWIPDWHNPGAGPATPSTSPFARLWEAYENGGDTMHPTPKKEFQTLFDRMPEEKAHFLRVQKEYLKRREEQRKAFIPRDRPRTGLGVEINPLAACTVQ